MRESCRIVKETLDFVGRNIRAGMTTKQVDELVYKYITSCGAYPSELGYEGYPGMQKELQEVLAYCEA